MKPMKLKPEEALFYLKDALCEHCEKECDTCDCIQLCRYGTAYQMAKEALTTKVAYVCKGSGADYPCRHTTDIAKAKNFKEVQPGSWIELMHDVDTSEWVPCSDRLPEISDNYLITTINGYIQLDYFNKTKQDFENYTAVAWKFLPDPYV